MSLKILLDPIYSGHMSRCSTAFKYRSIIEYSLAEGKTDWFFYWVIPPFSNMTEDELAWMPRHPQIKYIEFPVHEDRMREYMRFNDQMDMIFGFNGDFWDFDAIITVRTSQIANMRAVISSPRQKSIGRRLKKIVCLEEMLIIDTKPTVAKSDVIGQELQTITGYLCSDLTIVPSLQDKHDMIKTARKYLSPSTVIDMSSRIINSVAATLDKPKRKAPEFMFKKGERKMCLSFTGRMEKVSSNLDAIYAVMTNQFIMGGEQGIKLLICTVSKAAPEPPPDFVELRRPVREEFWRIAREEMDVMLILFNHAEMGLSMIEPMLLGVPAIIIDQAWTRSIWGPKYPFLVSNEVEAYAVAKAFRDDYDNMYAKFWKYMVEVFNPKFEDGEFSTTYYPIIHKFLADHETFLHGDGLRKMMAGRTTGEGMFPVLAAEAAKLDELVMFDFIRDLGKAGLFDFLQEKTKDGDRNRRRITFATPWNEFRVMFKAFLGFTDASSAVGHLKKVK